MRELGIPMDELFPSHLMIQGFNQGGQNAIGKIRLAMHIEDMESNALFHVIDAKTTYNMLLGRPWIHENGIISSTLHQCFKYCRNGQVRKIMADTDPFTIAEAHFADAKFYFKSNMMEELRSSPLPSPDHLGEGIIDSKSSKGHKSSTNEGVSQPTKNKGKEKVVENFVDNKPPHKAAALRYIPVSARKEGQSSFAKDEEKISKELENLTLPTTNLTLNKVSKPLLKGFVHQTESVVINLKGLPDKRSNGFDPNAYKLLARAGYSQEDINEISKDGDTTQLEGKQVFARTSKAWREKKTSGKTLRAGLGYESSTPLYFHINKEASRYINVEEVKDKQQSQPTPLRVSVWDRLGGTTNRAPVFTRIETQNKRVLKRASVFARLGQSTSKETGLMGDSKVLRSKIPSRMKRQYEWVVSAEETLKGKTRTIVITNPSNEEEEDEIRCLTSNHITIEEDDNDKFVVEEDVEEAPSNLESENKPTMDELKEKPEFIPYHKYALKLITSLDCVTLEHVPRKENKQADALANLASTLASCSEEINVPVCQRWVVPPLSHDIKEKEQVGVVSVYEIEKEDWRQPLIDYLRHGKLPNDLRHKTEVRRRASRFIYFQGTLYRRSFEGIFLRCLGEEEATKALEETHSGIWLSNEDNVRLRLEELEALDEKRLEAQQRLECYQARLCRAFNKKVRPRSFQEGDLVLAVRRPIIMSKRMGSKFLSKWDGPYVVQEVYTNGAYKIVDENGLRIGPINGKFLKRYYA
ncbi:hypothetical protein DKX38_023442 [Salix brachista]|uniref:RNase H type-1 domain-containing protein n=1 Tax=Salix brachista TaxID=2182728 RepID=A0A5N5JP96_9ROSI|nr:hypothetical protein DKX38_023442 [Salix brachista]